MRRWTSVRTARWSIRRPRAPTKRAAPAPSATRLGRPAVSQRSIARAAGWPNGTLRSLRPLPSTRTRLRSRSTLPTSRATSSPTRMPVAYSSSSMAASRIPTGSSSSAGPAAPPTSWAASSARRTGGRVRRALGEPRLAPWSASDRSVRASQAVNTRAAVARRASVVRERPVTCWLASQLRSVRRSSPAGSVMPSRAACVAQAGHVGQVRPHGVRAEVALDRQVGLEGSEGRRHRLGQTTRLLVVRGLRTGPGHPAERSEWAPRIGAPSGR